jgi:hypothetical protein
MYNYVPRSRRVRVSLGEMGVSVFSGMMTSVLAAMWLFGCQMQFFYKFGVFLCMTIFFSWVWANFFFTGFVATFGPEDDRFYHRYVHRYLVGPVQRKLKLPENDLRATAATKANPLADATEAHVDAHANAAVGGESPSRKKSPDMIPDIGTGAGTGTDTGTGLVPAGGPVPLMIAKPPPRHLHSQLGYDEPSDGDGNSGGSGSGNDAGAGAGAGTGTAAIPVSELDAQVVVVGTCYVYSYACGSETQPVTAEPLPTENKLKIELTSAVLQLEDGDSMQTWSWAWAEVKAVGTAKPGGSDDLEEVRISFHGGGRLVLEVHNCEKVAARIQPFMVVRAPQQQQQAVDGGASASASDAAEEAGVITTELNNRKFFV